MMAKEITKTGNGKLVQAVIERLKKETPGLKDLNPEQLEQVTKGRIFDDLKDELGERVKRAKIDYQDEREKFLCENDKHEARSKFTMRTYETAIKRLESFCERRKIGVLDMRRVDASDYITALVKAGRSAASIRLDVAVVKAFYSAMIDRHDFLKNPFEKIKGIPRRKDKKGFVVPSAEEVQKIIIALDGAMKAAAVVMATRGLRVGGLPTMTIHGGKFSTKSKAKEIEGIMPAEAIQAIKKAGLSGHAPFKGMRSGGISDAFKYITTKLHEAGAIREAYSVHDLRHHYAVEQFKKTKDIYRIKELLGHSSVTVTEGYLRGMGLV